MLMTTSLVGKIVDKLLRIKKLHLLWLSVLFSILFTLAIVSGMSLAFNGRVTGDYLITGIVTASIVSCIATFGLLIILEERQEVAAALKRNEGYFRSIAEVGEIVIYRLSPAGEVRYVSPAVFKQFGYEPKDVIGRHFLDFVMPADRAAANAAFQTLLSGESVIDADLELRRADGASFAANTNVTPIIQDGELFEAQGIIININKRKRAEAELTLHKNQLEDLVRERTAEFTTAINFLQDEIEFRTRTEETLRENEAKMRHLYGMKVLGELAAGVAHEVRNPLHALMSVTEALKKELKDNPDYDIFLFHIREQVERLSVLMKDLLDLGKPIEPSCLRSEPLADICLASIDLWKKSPSRREHSISFVQPSVDNVIIAGDSQRLQQVFLNLLENAAQHSSDNSEIQVVIAVADEDSVSVKVIDRGSGIPEEILPRIFEPFFTTRRRGTGLGLSIIKNILEGHGGSLVVRNNNPFPGCTAEVNLPFIKEVKL
jgi:PAS domain S-box-containing protein